MTADFPVSSQHRAPDSLAIDTRALYKFNLHYIVFENLFCVGDENNDAFYV